LGSDVDMGLESERERAATESTDEIILARVGAGETSAFELIMRRYNRRLYRTARAILGDDREAEDALQDAYVEAYLYLEQFEGRAKLVSWLTRIVVNEALRRTRRRERADQIGEAMRDVAVPPQGPEHEAVRAELRRALESAIDDLPEGFRTTFVLRDVEQLSTAETAESLGIPEDTVKTRLHRARVLLRLSLRNRFGEAARDAFPFGAARCDRMVEQVLARLATPLAAGRA
jgi:RNA polymerase sigma-70 factor, ECF subfamily